jgi:hypothetical protein
MIMMMGDGHDGDQDGVVVIMIDDGGIWLTKVKQSHLNVASLQVPDDPSYHQFSILSIAGNSAHQLTWCCIQKLCINSGEGR